MKIKKFFTALILIATMFFLVSCNSTTDKKIKTMEKVSTFAWIDIYKITYTDGSTEMYFDFGLGSNEIETEGNLEIGLVSDAELDIEITNLNELKNFKFLFEPAAADNTGRVRIDNETNLSESLEITIVGKISNPEVLAENGLTIQMQLPDCMKKAIDLGFIVAPKCAIDTVPIDVSQDGNFAYTIKFMWGSLFKGINPSEYFDDNQEGMAVSDAEVKTILEDLRACIYNYYDELNTEGVNRSLIIEAHNNDKLPTFVVIIQAIAN